MRCSALLQDASSVAPGPLRFLATFNDVVGTSRHVTIKGFTADQADELSIGAS